MARYLSKSSTAIYRDCVSLEKYKQRKIEFEQLKLELEQHNNCRLTEKDVYDLIKLGYER